MNNDIQSQNTACVNAGTKKKLFCFFAAAIIAAFVSAALYSLSFALFYDKEACYFQNGAILPVLANLFLIICICAALACSFFVRADELPRSLDKGGNGAVFVCLYSGFVSVFEAVCRVRVISTEWTDVANYFSRSDPNYDSMRLYRISFIVDIATVVFCIGCALYFISLARNGFRSNAKGSLLGMFAVLRAVIGIAQLYFDIKLALNSPVKLLIQFALMILTLYFLSETRYSLPLRYARPKYYLVTALSGLVASATASFSILLLYFTNNGYYSTTRLSFSFGEACLEAFFCLNIFIYILFRFSSFVRKSGPQPKDAEEKTEEPADNGTDTAAENAENTENADTADGQNTENGESREDCPEGVSSQPDGDNNEN